VYGMKALVFRYQSIDMHCIVVPVKFEIGLYISALRKKTTLYKKKEVKLYNFKERSNFKKHFETRHLEKGEI
jgi:hypothetical protein